MKKKGRTETEELQHKTYGRRIDNIGRFEGREVQRAGTADQVCGGMRDGCDCKHGECGEHAARDFWILVDRVLSGC